MIKCLFGSLIRSAVAYFLIMAKQTSANSLATTENPQNADNC